MKMTISVSGKEPQGARGPVAPVPRPVAGSDSLPRWRVGSALATGARATPDGRRAVAGFDDVARRLRRCRFVGIGLRGPEPLG